MRWECSFCGAENRTPVQERVYCQCGRQFVLAVVPIAATLFEPCVRPEPKHGKSTLCKCVICRDEMLDRKREYMREYRSA